MKSIFLKSPFFNQLKNKKVKYCVQLYGDYQKGEEILLCNARQKAVATIKTIRPFTISSIPWEVLDELNYRSKEQLENQLKSFYKRDEIPFVYVLELIVQ